MKILTTVEKCRECNGTKRIKDPDNNNLWSCPYCKGTGTITKNCYPLREFEICKRCGGTKTIWNDSWQQARSFPCNLCKGTGYKIPFKNYEIKKISEITEEEAERALVHTHGKEIRFGHFRTWLLYELQEKYNLKADDKLVIELPQET